MNTKNHKNLTFFIGTRAISDPVSIELSLKTIKSMKYASVERVMYLMMYYTGCRGEELDKMRKSNLILNTIYWHPCKGQKGFRKEVLPQCYIEELTLYWKCNRLPLDYLFGICYLTFCRYFNKLRPQLPIEWQEKKEILRNGNVIKVNKYCLNGLRKTFLTTVFGQEYENYKDSGMALEMTSQRALHSKTNITSFHYLKNMGELKKSKYWGHLPNEISTNEDVQETLLEFS